ncbi:MAG: VOC family protein [Micavibrio sp.]
MSLLYTSLVAADFIETVNFYEDYFGFAPVVEQESYVFMQDPENPVNAIAIFAQDHPCLKGRMMPSNGVILNIASHDIAGMYDHLYHEGVDVFKEPGTDIEGRKHFVISDPNGILVNIYDASSSNRRERELEAA